MCECCVKGRKVHGTCTLLKVGESTLDECTHMHMRTHTRTHKAQLDRYIYTYIYQWLTCSPQHPAHPRCCKRVVPEGPSAQSGSHPSSWFLRRMMPPLEIWRMTNKKTPVQLYCLPHGKNVSKVLISKIRMKQDEQTPEKDVPSTGAMKLPFFSLFF